MAEKPPYTITPELLSRVERIGEMIGRAETAGVSQDLRLRRINRIRTIHGSLAIEGNILSEEEIATILDGKPREHQVHGVHAGNHYRGTSDSDSKRPRHRPG